MADYFTTPTWTLNQAGTTKAERALFNRMRYCQVGFAVYRDSAGAYVQVTDPDDDFIKNSKEFYGGGRSYLITAQQKNDLTAAGYGAYITAVAP